MSALTELTPEDVLGPRPYHAHGDQGCFFVCPVNQYDLQMQKLKKYVAQVAKDFAYDILSIEEWAAMDLRTKGPKDLRTAIWQYWKAEDHKITAEQHTP